MHIFARNGDYSLYSARARKIPGWIVLVRENTVNKRAYINCIKDGAY